jgi:hypothetical protein
LLALNPRRPQRHDDANPHVQISGSCRMFHERKLSEVES